MKKYLLIFAAAALSLNSCSPFQVTSDYAETANFNSYKTYVFRTDDLKLNDIDKDRVLNEVAKNLQKKGLTPSQNADLVVNVIASHTKIKEAPRYGYGYFGGPSVYTEGNLVIDLIDAKTQKLVWQGKGNGLDVDSPNAKQQEIPQMVEQILLNYPPQRK